MTKSRANPKKAIHGFEKHTELERLVRQEIAGLEELCKLEYEPMSRGVRKKMKLHDSWKTSGLPAFIQ